MNEVMSFWYSRLWNLLIYRPHECLYKFSGYLRDDGIAVTAQSSHSGGYPISQRECAGFNWPEFPIPASEPVSI